MAVAYLPRVLRSLGEICETFGVGEGVVKQWAAAGAPIAVEGSGSRLRYSTEMAALQDWRATRRRPRDDGDGGGAEGGSRVAPQGGSGSRLSRP